LRLAEKLIELLEQGRELAAGDLAVRTHSEVRVERDALVWHEFAVTGFADQLSGITTSNATSVLMRIG